MNETHSDNAHIKRGGKALFRRACLWRQIAAGVCCATAYFVPQPNVHCDVEGPRKALAHAIGEYILNRRNVLTGPQNARLLGLPAQEGLQTM